MHEQISVGGAQTKELVELSAKIAQQSLMSVNAAATAAFKQLHKAD